MITDYFSKDKKDKNIQKYLFRIKNIIKERSGKNHNHYSKSGVDYV